MSDLSDRNLQLPHNDQRLLDALIEAGFERHAIGPLTDEESRRVDRLMRVFSLLNDYPGDDDESWNGEDDALIHATMARIARHEDGVAARMSLAESGARGGWPRLGFRLHDMIGVAAAVLLVAAVTLPLMNMVNQSRIDENCRNNMRQIGYGMSSYASDHNGQLPMALAGLGPHQWSWDTVANAVNLGPLLDGGYCSRGHFNCPGNHDNLEMTYSYQFQRPGVRVNWAAQTVVVLGDRNPLIDAARAGRLLPAMTMSADHRGRGQNVLRNDGTTMWIGDQPVVGREDNIWLPHGYEKLEPGARPEVVSDVFLAH
jgi:hypothetical protein